MQNINNLSTNTYKYSISLLTNYEIDDVKKLANRVDRELCAQILKQISEQDRVNNAGLVNMLSSEACDIGTALTIIYVLNDGVLVYENVGKDSRGGYDSSDETVCGFHVRGHVAVAPVQSHTPAIDTDDLGVKTEKQTIDEDAIQIRSSLQEVIKLTCEAYETCETCETSKTSETSETYETSETDDNLAVLESFETTKPTNIDDLSAFEKELANLEIHENIT